MNEENKKLPDHTLQGADIKGKDEPPMLYAVTDLRAYVKPEMAEELGAGTGGGLTLCGTEVMCTCVPVETCACNTVGYKVGGTTCPGFCACQCTCTHTWCLPYYYL
jgi:hypothetical protein